MFTAVFLVKNNIYKKGRPKNRSGSEILSFFACPYMGIRKSLISQTQNAFFLYILYLTRNTAINTKTLLDAIIFGYIKNIPFIASLNITHGLKRGVVRFG